MVAVDFSLRFILSKRLPVKSNYTDLLLERFPGSWSERVPPDPIPNSVVKTLSADDSVGSPHVKVGHCQD